MLECAINVQSTDYALLASCRAVAETCLIDTHVDRLLGRAVLTLCGSDTEAAVRAIARTLLASGAGPSPGQHPHLGLLDVVPFVDLDHPGGDDLTRSLRARDDFAKFAGETLGLPCFCYGGHRALPSVRRQAFATLAPDYGPSSPHPRAGSCCVGARGVLVAYNLYVGTSDRFLVGEVARKLRSPAVRALVFDTNDGLAISCNLVAPYDLGPAEVFDAVSRHFRIRRAELVGLVPEAVLRASEQRRWSRLDLAVDRTIEARLASLKP